MPTTLSPVAIVPILISVGFIAWVFWRWLRASDEPVLLIIRWVITAVVLGFLFSFAARAKDEISKIAAILLAALCGVIMTLVWRQKFCDWVAGHFTSLYTGGKQEIDPAPFFSIAHARRKQGRYAEAIAEVRQQLTQFPNNFSGWMLLAEIQAEDLKDVGAAQHSVEQILLQEGHAAKNIAYALNRVADWHLKLTRDREAAQTALERIVQLLPGTEQEQLALQRIAHLTPAEMLVEQEEPRRIAIQAREQNIGLRMEPLDLRAPEEDPAEMANKFVQHLEQFPFDHDTREKLALLYARHYQRLDLATDQLEQLINIPNQPPKMIVRWLNLLADVQVELGTDLELPKQTLQRIVEQNPKSAAAENALSRIAHLKLELRPKQQNQAIKLGSYEQNIGLKRRSLGENPQEEESDR